MSVAHTLETHDHHARVVATSPSRIGVYSYAKAKELRELLVSQAEDKKYRRAYAIELGVVQAVWCLEQSGTRPFSYVAHMPRWAWKGPFWAAINKGSFPLTANLKEEGIHTRRAAHRFASDAFMDEEVSTVIFLNDSRTGVHVAWERNPVTHLPVLVAWSREWQGRN